VHYLITPSVTLQGLRRFFLCVYDALYIFSHD